MTVSLTKTDFNFTDNQQRYQGKVRDVYTIDSQVILVATDRISAFDVVSKQGITHKGQVLNQIAAFNLEATKDLVPNWVQSVPDPNVTVGVRAEVFKIEVIMRRMIVGSAWRAYRDGSRSLAGVDVPDGLVENQEFDNPILTPSTKAAEGHDEDISAEEIIEQGLASEAEWQIISEYAHKLFERGNEIAVKQGLILVDTKYEFGKTADGQIILIDEIHTPDSSRYFYAEDYKQRFEAGESPRQLSKEFVREWLLERGYKGQNPDWPEMPEEFVQQISQRYIELYEQLTGEVFKPADYNNIEQRIINNVESVIK
ncbi:phosphoribosylaminoimidazolesuccinocarboxamide synthase [Candidatus Saccharibacteria bacterium]|nr:phosphoribosylaminoimidazolesuccinocarboxamide synthase [Candidatus Saccharibacteria bacterium]MBP7018714.1 phosphoribosylaminoimidazolesuccinocarboxamide synthase [Candidatus Saccharibacteria bacterium]